MDDILSNPRENVNVVENPHVNTAVGSSDALGRKIIKNNPLVKNLTPSKSDGGMLENSATVENLEVPDIVDIVYVSDVDNPEIPNIPDLSDFMQPLLPPRLSKVPDHHPNPASPLPLPIDSYTAPLPPIHWASHLPRPQGPPPRYEGSPSLPSHIPGPTIQSPSLPLDVPWVVPHTAVSGLHRRKQGVGVSGYHGSLPYTRSFPSPPGPPSVGPLGAGPPWSRHGDR